jgi:Domain of unknown function (DUF4105)
MRILLSVGRQVAWAIAWLIAIALGAWSVVALYFDLPDTALRAPAAGAFALVLIGMLVFLRGRVRKLAALFLGFIVVLCWWLTLRPSNDRQWQPDVGLTPWAEIRGDEVTLHNVRNCDYRTATDYTPRWEARTVRFSQLTGLDIAINYWGSPWIAHPIVSFQFADAPPLAFSVETRREVGESYSALRGFFRQYELIYIVADERDVLRARTNYRSGEEVYLYRTRATPEQARTRFMEYLSRVNELHAHPEWYHAVTSNCTTSIRAQRAAAQRAPWDWRLLLNGKGDELLYERGALAGGLPFVELKQRALINVAAQAADAAPDFSQRIREARPGF